MRLVHLPDWSSEDLCLDTYMLQLYLLFTDVLNTKLFLKNVSDKKDAVNLLDIMTVQMYVPNKNKKTHHNNKKLKRTLRTSNEMLTSCYKC